MIKHPFLVSFVFWFATASPAKAELVCALGQPDYTAADKSVNDLATAASLLKAAAKGKGSVAEAARQQRLQLAYAAIENALKSEAINEMPRAAAFWRLAVQDLGDTRWRMNQEVKSGSAQARWLAQELSEHAKKEPWQASACNALGPKTDETLSFSVGAQYRRALCTAKTSPKDALELMKIAANGGHPAAMEAYGRLCAEQGEIGRACAVDMLCRAADAGRKSAAGLAAYLLTSEAPTPALAVKAAALYEMAFAAGDAASANNLGEVYERGWIGSPNIAQAEVWYRKASEAGITQANLNLARLLWRSVQSRPEARSLIESARTVLPTEATQLLLQLEGSRD